ncbi:oligopeptide ABC transporter permease OppB [unidentified bacterial endosymbiont]|uniref:oligopeptide ABC transporter permease OppB n=1 Tax=unidentified bacterial endosymbiont TaxID=2355 RepID=UPI00209D4408|nr:oligopeptide ABC transporter permease OppB [unidentified bacterial endosymbiont]
MGKLIVRRCLEALPTLFILITISFFLMHLTPGSPFATEEIASPELLAQIEAKYHLDAPLYQQYGAYLRSLLRGQLGYSFKYLDHTVSQLIAAAFPVSLQIGGCAFVIAVLLGMSAGITAALRHNGWLDHAVMLLAMIGVILPSFVKGPLLVLIFAVWLRWLPAGGWNGGELLRMILPISALVLSHIATIARLTRGSMLEVLHSSFIRTAREKGLPMRHIVWCHALKPAMLPVISYLGPTFASIITGSVVIEAIFGLPGMGQLLVNGAFNRDYLLVLSLTLLIGIITILFNAVIDILYAFLDPKLRY